MARVGEFVECTPAESVESRLRAGAPVAPVALDFASRRMELLDFEGVLPCPEPFFHQTLERVNLQSPERRPAEIRLERFVQAVPRGRPAPHGFLFHVGRCGSTLLANILASSGQTFVLREPGLLIDLSAAWLETGGAQTLAEIESLFELALPQLLWATAGTATCRLVKPAAWNLQVASVLMRLFPHTQAVFLFRAPAETVASMLHKPPAWAGWITGRPRFGSRYLPSLQKTMPDEPLSPAKLFVHAWRSAAEAALALPSDRVLFLDYSELATTPKAVLERVLSHFGLTADEEVMRAMLAEFSIYSKDVRRQAQFDPNGHHRRPPLTEEDAAVVRSVAAETWHRLQQECRMRAAS